MIKDKSKMLFTGRQIAAIILPLLLQNILAITIGMADSMMVSNKGEEAFALYENRCKVAKILQEIVRLDHMAECMIEKFLKTE